MIALFFGTQPLFSTNPQGELDSDSSQWAVETLAAMPVVEKIRQLLVPSFFSSYTSSDSEAYQELTDLIHEYHVGGMLVFGARQLRSDLLLNSSSARNILGQPLAATSFLLAILFRWVMVWSERSKGVPDII